MASNVSISYHGRLSRGQGLAAPAPGHGRLPGARFLSKIIRDGWRRPYGKLMGR